MTVAPFPLQPLLMHAMTTRSSFLAVLHLSLLIFSCGLCSAAREEPAGTRPEGTYLPIWERRLMEALAVSVVVVAVVAVLVCLCRKRSSGAVWDADDESREWPWSAAGEYSKPDHPMSISPTMVRSAGSSPEPRHYHYSVSSDSRALSPSPHRPLALLLALPVPADGHAPSLASHHRRLPMKRLEKDPFSTYSPASWVPPEELDYERLQEATDGFNRKSRLGQSGGLWQWVVSWLRQSGGQWVVYKGTNFVQDEGLPAVVAIKKFNEIIFPARRKDMMGDLRRRTTTLRHKNVVRLLGYSFGKGHFHLVYSYMPNGSLHERLFRKPGAAAGLTWPLRYSVINDIARGLYHLHVTGVPHGSIKASKVMLEQDLTALLDDHFGYQPSQSGTPRGSLEKDILDFGALILQVVCGPGRPPRPAASDLVDRVWTLYRRASPEGGARPLLEAVDPALAVNFDSGQASKLLLLALGCSHPDEAVRLKIHDVRKILADQAPLTEVPSSIPPETSFVQPP